MTLPTARENAVNTWGTPSSVPDDDKVKILSVHHATQATEQRDKDIAKELRRVMKKSKEEKTPFMQELTCVIETIDVIDELEGKLDGEKVSR